MPNNELEPLTKLSPAEKELLVPADIKSNFENNHYDPQIMQAIIIDIATTTDSIDDICKRHGMSKRTIYWWRSVSTQLLHCWRAAQRHRAHATADNFEPEVRELDTQIDTDDNYKRISNRIRRFDRVWSHRQWFMSRYNRQDFGDKLDIDSNVTVAPAKAREQAYNTFQSAQEADFEDITLPQLNQSDNSNNKQ